MTNDQTIKSYKTEVHPLPDEDGGGYEALYPQIGRSVVGYGATQADALHDLSEASTLFLEIMEETGQTPPLPKT